MKRRRWLRVTKWAVTVLCVLTLAVYAASGWYRVYWAITPTVSVGIAAGCAYVQTSHGVTFMPNSKIPTCGVEQSMRLRLPSFEFEFARQTWFLTDGQPPPRYVTFMAAPLWAPSALLILLTAAFWWLDRRRIPAGHCRKCGYDLCGNVSGKCPECGWVTAGSSDRKHDVLRTSEND